MYTFANYRDAFTYSFQNLGNGFIGFVPNFLIAVILFVLGWVIGSVVGRAVEQVINALKVDKALDSAGAGKFTHRTGMRINVAGFIAGIVKWFIIAGFLMACLSVLNLNIVNDFILKSVVGYLPKVIVAALILVIATVLADFVGKAVTASAKASSVRSANFLGTLTHYAIWISAFIIVLGQLGIAAVYMQYLFIGIVAMLSIAGGLAFGLGGKEFAARALESLRSNVKPSNGDHQ